MKKITYRGKNDFYFESVDSKKCNTNEVEIEVKIMGLCGSDLHKFLKQTPVTGYLKTEILGHEIMGIVSKIGSDCRNVTIGDRVVINPFNVPFNHELCDSFSLTNDIDIVGRNIDGGYSEKIYLPKNCVYKLPDTINDEDAIFIDDIAVVLHGLHYTNDYCVIPKNIAIIGDGPLGILSYKVFSSYFKNANIKLFSKNLKKINFLNINCDDFKNINNYGQSFDLVIEAVGGNQSETLNAAIYLGANNCLILCYGVYQFNYKADIDVRSLFYKQGTLKGINSYCNKHSDFEEAIELLKNNKITVNELITDKIDFNNAIEYIKNYENHKKNSIKTIFKVLK